ncbi:MAG: endonuclease III [Ruminococcaceae bacterium]|nr:endonuclease III [Oscillospiraceae bacterium]
MKTITEINDKERAARVLAALEELYPNAACSLEADGDPWKLLVMARLSAQCTDERVNIISKGLFEAFPTAGKMADGPIEEIEGLIKSCGLYRGKAKSIKETSKIIAEKYACRVPDTMEELLALPGVGRKIANLILGDVYNKGGIVSDTHCMRICGRLGFYPEDKKDPRLTERIMTPLIDKEKQSGFCHRLVLFGRDICTARSPKCRQCPMRDFCLHFEKAALPRAKQ